jgi:ankyrin repeat protein
LAIPVSHVDGPPLDGEPEHRRRAEFELSTEFPTTLPSADIDCFQSSILSSIAQSENLQALKLAAFLVSNGFDLSENDARKILELLERQPNFRLLELVLFMKGPTFEALKKNLFKLVIKNNNLPILKILLKCGINPDQYLGEQISSELRDFPQLGYYQPNPLEISCYHGHFLVAGHLHLAGANSRNVLPYAVRGLSRSHVDHLGLDFIGKLVKMDGSLNRNWSTMTPLSIAARNGEVEVVKILIDARVNVNQITMKNNTALLEALQGWNANGHDRMLMIVKALVSAGARVEFTSHGYSSNRELRQALAIGAPEVVQIVLDAGAQITTEDVAEVAESGKLDLLQVLLKRRSRASSSLSTRDSAYTFAVAEGKCDLIKTLAASSAPIVSFLEFECLMVFAIEANDIELVLAVVRLGKQIESTPTTTKYPRELLCTSLRLAVERGRTGIVLELLQIGAMNNTSPLDNRYGFFALLSVAIILKNVDLVNILLKAGADLNEPPSEENLLEAVSLGEAHIVQGLLAFGMTVCRHCNTGCPLITAI